MSKRFSIIYNFFLNKWYFDEFYDFLLVKPLKKIGLFLWLYFDKKIIDGLGPDGVSSLVLVLSRQISKFQTGYVYHYAFAMLVGLAIILSFFLIG